MLDFQFPLPPGEPLGIHPAGGREARRAQGEEGGEKSKIILWLSQCGTPFADDLF